MKTVRSLTLVSGLVIGLASFATASETFSLADAQGVVGAAANLNQLNAADLTFASLGNYQLSRVRASFSVTEINGTTIDFISENRLRLWAPGSALSSAATLTLTPVGGGYTGTVAGTASAFLPLNALINPIGTWSYRWYNSADDAPLTQADSAITAISLQFNFPLVTPTATHLGGLAPAASINFNTETSVITGGNDTEIGVYFSDGRLVGQDDDSGTGALSNLNLANLPIGTYYIAVGGFNTDFQAGFAVSSASAAVGNIVVNVGNGISTLTGGGALTAAQVQWYSVTIPTPGTLALLAGAGLIVGRRRR